jgi:hypothetical protein
LAKVILPLMSQAARGKSGPLVYNQWRSLNTVKMLKSPVQPRTAAQLAARALLAAASSSWAALTADQRAAWQQYAIDHLESDWTGASKRLTAQNWYIRCHVRAALVSGATVTDPPTASAPAAITGLAFTNSGGHGTALSMAWATPTSSGDTLLVYRCGPISLGRIPRIEQASILAKVTAETTSPHTVIASAVAGRYGFWVVVIAEATGLASQPVYAECISA